MYLHLPNLKKSLLSQYDLLPNFLVLGLAKNITYESIGNMVILLFKILIIQCFCHRENAKLSCGLSLRVILCLLSELMVQKKVNCKQFESTIEPLLSSKITAMKNDYVVTSLS